MAKNTVKDNRKIQLIQATIDSIAKRGLTETTITHICSGAGMSRGIVNFYFTSKESMMRDVLSHLLDEYETIWFSTTEKADSPRAKLEALITAHFDKKICAPKRLNVLSAFWGHAASHDAYRSRIDESDSQLQAKIAALWAESEPQGYNPQAFARQLHALIRGLWLEYLMAPRTSNRDAMASECIAFIDQHRRPLALVNEPAASAPAAKAKAKKRAASAQLDIDDLFANMK